MKSEWSLPARYFALALVIAFLVFIVYQTREMIRPLILAGVIAYLFYPFVSLLQQHFKLNRRQASNVVYFASLAVMIALPIVLVPILSHQTTEIAFDLQQVLTQAEQYLAKPIIVGGAVLDLSSVVAQYKNALLAVFSSTPQNAIQLIRNTSRSTLWGIVVLVSTYFFMTEWENLREGMIRLAPETYRQDIRRLYAQVRQVWTAYLRGQLTLMLIVAVTFIIVWTVIGLPGSLYLGFLAGLFSIVPDVGPFVATVLALTVALLEGSKWLPINNFLFGLLVVVLYAVLINIKGVWLRPRILGRSVHMHEAVVFVAIIAAVIFTGVLGAFIIIPVLASLGVIWNYLHARILGLVPFQDEKYASYPDLEAPAITDKKNNPVAKAAKKRSK
ncbi:MAG: AI-2E family transporter [Chloroflexi bacterium]|nr:AI-2E family transporter [Chloroflexota bacterium]